MKKLIYLSVLFPLILFSCDKYDIPSTYSFDFKVEYPDDFNEGVGVANISVKVLNVQTNREYIETTDNDGIAQFSLRGGNYNFVVSFSEEHEIEIDGYQVKKTILFNGALNGQVITSEGGDYNLKLEYSVSNEGFIIKELYCSGCRTPEDKSYGADKFVEIYNNTDKVLYSDGLCFGVVYPNTTFRPTPYVDDNGDLLDRIPVWSFVAIVPGEGEDYPIQPGDSFIIALSGLNHRDDPNGNPNSIDLSIADWEMYVEDGKYADVPSVPNILMQRITKGSAMTFDQRGTVCILFRLPSDEDIETIFTDTDNYFQAVGSYFNCFMVPKAWIFEGVENAILDDRGVYKRLHNEIDVGYIQYRGSLEGVSIRRKVSEVVDGRVVYEDTNNSAEDFLTDQEPMPGVISAN